MYFRINVPQTSGAQRICEISQYFHRQQMARDYSIPKSRVQIHFFSSLIFAFQGQFSCITLTYVRNDDPFYYLNYPTATVRLPYDSRLPMRLHEKP